MFLFFCIILDDINNSGGVGMTTEQSNQLQYIYDNFDQLIKEYNIRNKIKLFGVKNESSYLMWWNGNQNVTYYKKCAKGNDAGFKQAYFRFFN